MLLCALWGILSVSAQHAIEIPVDVWQWLDEELERAPVKASVNMYSDAFFDETPARLVGYLKGYNPESDLRLGRINISDRFRDEYYPVLVKIMPDGRFEADLPMWHPVRTSVWFNEEPSASFYIEPGLTVALIIDWEKDKKRAAAFQGPLSGINKELIMLEDSVPVDPYFLAFSTGPVRSPLDLKAESIYKYEDYCTRLDEFVQAHPVSRKAQDIMKHQMITLYAVKILEHGLSNRFSASPFPLPATYYDVLAALPLDNPLLMISGRYDTFLSQFGRVDPFHTMESIRREFGEAYYDLYLNSLPLRRRDEIKRSVKEQKGTTPDGASGPQFPLIHETMKVRLWHHVLADFRLGADDAESFIAGIAHPFLRRQAAELWIVSQHKINKRSYELPEGEGTDIFRKIIDTHKGKYVIVSFWATNHGLGVTSNRFSKEIREKYKDHPEFDFVFITNDKDSPQEIYDKMVREQGLLHSYRLPVNEYLYLPALLRFQYHSMPCMLIDKEGNIVYNNIFLIGGISEATIMQLLNLEKRELLPSAGELIGLQLFQQVRPQLLGTFK